MFIREIRKKNKNSDKVYVSHRLVDSVRTAKGPRQVILLELGTLDLPKEEWKSLANRIEEIVTGQQCFSPPPPHIEEPARYYASLLLRKELASVPEAGEAPDFDRVDLNSLTLGQSRTIGGEAAALSAFRKLKLPEILTGLGFSPEKVHRIALLAIGRLLHPASELGTAFWAKNISGLGELLETDFASLSHNALYRASDELLAVKAALEEKLAGRERELFDLKESVILYDLTNTYFEGCAAESEKALHGRSKEKRSDCPLVTLALVLDGDGFPKTSRVFPGQVGEPKTLDAILEDLSQNMAWPKPHLEGQDALPTLVIDAGVAAKVNLAKIKAKGFHYLAVSRSRPKEVPAGELIVIREDKDLSVKAKKIEVDGETVVFCQSAGRNRKEESIKKSFQARFEEGLKGVAASLTKKRGQKKYEKVLFRLGRLQAKFPVVGQYYQIDVEQKDGLATAISWSVKDRAKMENRFSGSYYLRTDRTDLDEKALWSLYMMLTGVEDAFRSMKSALGLRPIFHRKDSRIEAHLFITVLAYHLLAVIQRQLKERGIHHRWETIRTRLSTLTRVTAALTNDKGERIHIRKTTDPEPVHLNILRALGVPFRILKTKKIKL
jgi:transposase